MLRLLSYLEEAMVTSAGKRREGRVPRQLEMTLAAGYYPSILATQKRFRAQKLWLVKWTLWIKCLAQTKHTQRSSESPPRMYFAFAHHVIKK
jgi:hypothetical protein